MENTTLDRNCPCCSEFINQGIFTPYRKGRCIAQSKHFIIFPAVGSLMYPYLIMEPKFHVNSFSKLSERLLDEAKYLLLEFITNICDKCELVIAEHGENFKSLEHAHIHIMIFENNNIEKVFWGKLKKYSQNTTENASLDDYFHNTLNNKEENEYTIIWSQLRNSILGFNSNSIPQNNKNQFIRRLLGEIFNKPWNWLAYEGIENIEAAYDYFSFEKVKI